MLCSNFNWSWRFSHLYLESSFPVMTPRYATRDCSTMLMINYHIIWLNEFLTRLVTHLWIPRNVHAPYRHIAARLLQDRAQTQVVHLPDLVQPSSEVPDERYPCPKVEFFHPSQLRHSPRWICGIWCVINVPQLFMFCSSTLLTSSQQIQKHMMLSWNVYLISVGSWSIKLTGVLLPRTSSSRTNVTPSARVKLLLSLYFWRVSRACWPAHDNKDGLSCFKHLENVFTSCCICMLSLAQYITKRITQ